MKESINKLKIHKGTYEQIQENMENIGEKDFVFITDKSVPIPNASDVGKTVMVNAQGEFILAHKTTQVSYVYDTFDLFKSSLRYTAESPYELTSIITSSNEEVKIKNIPLGTEIYIAEEDVPDYWLYTKKIDVEEDVQGGLGFFRTMETKPKANAIIEVETLPENPLETVFYKTKKGLSYIIDGKWHMVQDKLTFDETPTEGSTNPVTSGGLHKILKDGVGGIIDVESLPHINWKGTVVPTDGVTPVTNIYLNNQLSIEETVSILDEMTYQEVFGSLACYFLVDYINETFLLAAIIKDGKHAIVDQKSQTLYFIEDKSILDGEMEVTFTGWNPDITYPIEVNFIVQYMEVEGFKLNLTDYTPYTSLISTTPFVPEQGNVNDKCIYRLRKDDLKGTPLPYDANTVVENLYFNTSLSVDEVVSICENNLSKSHINLLTVAPNQSEQIVLNNSYILGYVAELDVWAIANFAMLSILEGNVVEGAKLLFVSKPVPELGVTFEGWNPDITYPIAYNYPRYTITEMEENSGFDGELISDLVSMRPYKTISTYTYWVFKNKWVQLLTDEDIKTDIVRIYKDADVSLGQGLNITLSEFNLMASADTCELITSYTTSAEGSVPATAKAIYRKVTQLESNGVPIQLSFLCASIVWFQTTYDNAIITITNDNGTITTNYIKQPSQLIEGFEYGDFSIKLRYYDGFEYLYKELSYDEYPFKDSQNLVSSGGVYTELDKKLTKSLSDVSSTTNVATTDNMLINKAGTMYKVTIQELQEVFGSANYKGNFVSVSALPATGTAGDYAFVKVVTDGDTDLIMYIWNDIDKHWEETGTLQYVKNVTFQATMNTKQDKLDVSLDEKGTMNIVIPESIEGAKTIKVNGVELVPVMEDITWENLKTLRDEGKLIPGKSYKIIDYTCTTSQADTISAHHDFDIIVTADSSNTLSETARASLKEGDTYYRTTGGETWTLMPVGYQYVDVEASYGDLLQSDEDIFIEASYAENPHGYNSPVLYKTDYDAYVSGDPDMSLPDYNDPFFYFGTWELNGVVYDRWKKHETNEKAFTWSSDDEGDLYILTEQLVQGTPNSSDPNNFDPSNCTFIEEKITPTPVVYEVCNLSAWELKYCLDNDTTRFAWADTTNGKGVIYYMKDDHGNEAWYDFKSIKVCRGVDVSVSCYDESLWKNTPIYADTSIDESYFYTFHLQGDTDLSVKALFGPAYNDDIELWHPKNNKVNPYYIRQSNDSSVQKILLAIPCNVFFADENISVLDGNPPSYVFLWENVSVSGYDNTFYGSLWNVDYIGCQGGVAGAFDHCTITTLRFSFIESTLQIYSSIIHISEYYDSGAEYMIRIPQSCTLNNNICIPHDEPHNVYQYVTGQLDPILISSESYEEEEE